MVLDPVKFAELESKRGLGCVFGEVPGANCITRRSNRDKQNVLF
jgi:hypothetical protein